ncbi:ABC transporter ATP-binding protein [Ruminococcus sp.]|jgi:ABC-2 type transport system ATP-binding protein|uniref:ABC transporter ATP-binding protein n=1 Tax=Ruminococcus sp. TaxID=41978 RepID=UPI00260D80E5|nr:ABC transporter ATP-binding protein [Ruminococcus sp.]MCI2112280.1 ABC transporter ATP-binding protein [Ruminococcus sp.]MDD6987960.1 ABC transporter ATP-binding protein [Ruminococcus sp.]MDY6201560.1 ABC transporter ATP-binding protein [Ruminococcus sp.]
MNVIEIKGLTKYYGKSRGIIDLNLSVAEGEFFGFIGPNGAGKSTTIRTILGLIKKSGGSAEIFGKNIETNKKEILADVGYLPSEAVFYSGMKVKDVIKLSADLRKKDCKKESNELCERLELDTEKRVEELSFGNRKKVAIVCALQHKPHLCVLDEPTGGLDPLMQREFFSILKERNAVGATIFLSSHILSEIQRNCTRAAIVREGKLIACDSVESLSKTNAKRIHIDGNADISSLKNVRDVQKTDNGISFLYSGDINEFLQYISKFSINDLSISEPDLEEIFMHYYLDGGDRQ